MSLPHWEYFLAIESDLEYCSRYVEFCSGNYKTYSIEFARIIMACGSELDTIFKLLCNSIDSNKKPKKILEYFEVIRSKYPNFPLYKISVPRYKMLFQPWKNYSETESPDWWQAYNKIKHERDKYYQFANLENALKSITGLLCGLLYYYKEVFLDKEQIDYSQRPKLLSPDDPSGLLLSGGFWAFYMPE